jgi:hypothetical protein
MLTVLFQGILDPGELSQEDRLVAAVMSNYSMVLAHDGDDLFKNNYRLIRLTYLRRGVLAKHSDRK